jgi:hypothetical protein
MPYAITRWAGRHPWLVRLFIVPVLFYFHARIAFILGAELYFDHHLLPYAWVWVLIGILAVATLAYPANARELLRHHYWRVKSLEAIGCMTAFGLWVYVGNHAADYFETEARAAPTVTIAAVQQGSLYVSENPATEERGFFAPVKRLIKNYHRGAIARIKAAKGQRTAANAGLIFLSILGIGLGIVVLVCTIQCGSGSGAVALGVIGGLALIGLGIWALVRGLRSAARRVVSP